MSLLWSYNDLIRWINSGCNKEIALNVISLDCSKNKLTSLPSEIKQLTNLTILNCTNNKLTSSPPEIGQLTNLIMLNCSNNKLTSLPPEISQLTNLSILDYSENELTSLPSEIGQLTRLIIFQYFNNPIEYIPPQVVRFLNRMKKTQNVYNDSQSVHNHNIQLGITNGINYITSLKPTINNLNDTILGLPINENTKKYII